MTVSLKKYAKAVMASVLVFTLVLQLFQGMGYVLAQQETT